MEGNPMICVPGQRLCVCDKTHIPGRGTYERDGYIHSSLVGVVDVVDKNGIIVMEVRGFGGGKTLIPAQGDIITAQITILTLHYCRCLIKGIGDTVLNRPFRAILRKEDIRATEKDRVEIYQSFRPGDIILARVLPITDGHTYNLSTAENELGVVTAYSEHGHPMVPISWTKMQCTKTFTKESRKVAKVVPDNITQKMKDLAIV